ncbi:MAG: hypothetical protein WCI43_07505, partial [Candidatus Firestonebacteria bacterium]
RCPKNIDSYKYSDEEIHNLSMTLQKNMDNTDICKLHCENCLKTFSRSDNLKKHMKTSCKKTQNDSINTVINIENKTQNNIGNNIVTEGIISKTHNTGKVCFMNFKQGLNLYLTVVIFASDFKKFPENPEQFYLDKKVKVSGKVKEYKGTPEIILKSTDQIEVIK